MNFNSSIFCLITGASRGIGQKIAEKMAQHSQKITFVLIARSACNETENKLKKINPDAIIHSVKLDLSTAKMADFQQIFDSFKAFDSAIIFHNAGHIGEIRDCKSVADPDAWRNYYDLNLFSVTCLNAIFLQHFAGIREKIVVNLTSLVGRKPFKFLSMYGSAKAARELYFKVLAVEEPALKVLSYSPGMVDTEMVDELMAGMKDFPEVIAPDSAKLRPEQTVDKLMELLKDGFTSGAVVDYYD